MDAREEEAGNHGHLRVHAVRLHRQETDTALPAGKREIDYVYDKTRLERVEDSDQTARYSYDDFGSVVKVKSTLKNPNTVHPPLPAVPDLPATCGEMDTDGGTARYCYDEFERLVAGRVAGESKENAVFTYDGLDRRDTKTVKTSSGDRVRDMAYVGTTRMLTREQDADGQTKYYDYASNGEREGQAKASAGTTDPSRYFAYGKDANGSIEELSDENGSTSTEAGKKNEYAYDPHGELDPAGDTTDDPETNLGPEAKDNPFRYEGFYYDSGVKTYDMGARQYDSYRGQFLSQDRFESARGDLNLQADPLTQNRYAFAGGNPVTLVEFDGHEPVEGSFKNNPDRDNQYGGNANSNINPYYNYGTSGGQWVVSEQGSAAVGRSSLMRAAARPAPPPRRVPIPGVNNLVFAPDAGRSGLRSVDPVNAVDNDRGRVQVGGAIGLEGGDQDCACLPLRSRRDTRAAATILSFVFGPEVAASKAAGGVLGFGLKNILRRGGVRLGDSPRQLGMLPSALKKGPKNVHVYRGLDENGNAVYAGITNNLERRASQHGDRFSALDPVTTSPVTRGEARAIEQAMILRDRGQNRINAISPDRPFYDDAVEYGEAWLRNNGR